MKAQPKTLTVTLYIHAKKQFDGSYEYAVYPFKADPNNGLGFVIAEHNTEIPFSAPTSSEMILIEINSLKEQQSKILADAHIQSSQLEDKIQMLLCLEGKPISKSDEQIPY